MKRILIVIIFIAVGMGIAGFSGAFKFKAHRPEVVPKATSTTPGVPSPPGQKPTSSTPSPSANGFLRVEGSKIVDGSGNLVQLRGFNTYVALAGYKYFNKFYTQDQLKTFNQGVLEHWQSEYDNQNMKDMGANVIRTFLPEFHKIQYAPYQYDEKFLDVLEEFVSNAGRHGIRTILVMNQTGESEVYYIQEPGVLWTDPDRKNQVYALWEHIAARFANNPNVAGYDLMNEPKPPSDAALHDFYQNSINAIRKHDTRHIIFMDTKHFPVELNWGGTYTDTNLVLQTHYYYFGQDPSGAQIQNHFNILLHHPDRQGKPLYIGEFGMPSDESNLYGQKELAWIKKTIDVMNANGVHWTYFAYKDSIYNSHPTVAWPVYNALYLPSERLFISPTKEVVAGYLQNGFPMPTAAQLESLHTEHFRTNATLRSILSQGFKAP